jgi:hypothetical protein
MILLSEILSKSNNILGDKNRLMQKIFSGKVNQERRRWCQDGEAKNLDKRDKIVIPFTRT